MVKKMIHIEGLTLFAAMICLYGMNGFPLWVFLLFLLAPDISMIAYGINNTIGAKIYNLFHTTTLSVPVILLGAFLQHDLILIIGIIWTAHIGMDRLFGFGLKYQTSFQDTHLQKL